MSTGNRIYMKRQLPDKELLERFKKIPVANVGDCMGRNCAMHHSIHLMTKTKKIMCGPALTVHSRGGDNLFFHQALDMAQEGDVIVVSTHSCDTNSIIGENIVCNAVYKKLGGLVFDAPIRDIAGVSKVDLPIYATGTTPGGPHKGAPGEINVPISCGGTTIFPGDIIIGDQDGVIVVPRKNAEEIVAAAEDYHILDQKSQAEAKNGSWDREWIAQSLAAAGVEFINDYYTN